MSSTRFIPLSGIVALSKIAERVPAFLFSLNNLVDVLSFAMV